MTASTNHRILIKTSIENKICEEPCNILVEKQKMKEKINSYHGKIINAKIFNLNQYKFYALENTKLLDSVQKKDKAKLISAPIEVVADLMDLKVPDYNEKLEAKINFIKRIHENVLHQTITTKTGENYYISNILPGRLFASNLALYNLNIKNNPLDIILSQLDTSSSINIIEKDVEQNTISIQDDDKMKSLEENNIVFAEFDNIKSASNYYHDQENYCSRFNYAIGKCDKAYKYHVEAAISNPLSIYEKFQDIWTIFKFFTIILSILSVIIATSTYTRIIAKEEKVISLYKTMRATKSQITKIFTIHLLLLSITTIFLSLLIAIIINIFFNIINGNILQKTFTLGLSINVKNTLIFGCNPIIIIPTVSLILSAFLAIIINSHSFSIKKIIKI